jgi:hypothetical protein
VCYISDRRGTDIIPGPQLKDVLAIRRHRDQGGVGIQPAINYNLENSYIYFNIYTDPSMYTDLNSLVNIARFKYKAGNNILYCIKL